MAEPISELDRRIVTFAGLARHFLDWADLFAPLDDIGGEYPVLPEGDRRFSAIRLADYAVAAEHQVADISLAMEGIESFEPEGQHQLQAILPGFIGFRAAFFRFIEAWGFAPSDSTFGGVPMPRYSRPPGPPSGPPPVSPSLMRAMDRGITSVERTLREKIPLLTEKVVLAMTDRGTFRVEQPNGRRMTIRLDGDRSAVILGDVEHRVTEQGACFVKAAIEAGEEAITFAGMKKKYLALKRANESRTFEELPAAVRETLAHVRGYRATE